MALMLLAVEALYISDKMVTHLLFDALRNQLGVSYLLETLILAAPEILSVGFPVSVVLAVYLTLLRRREAGDFVILASAGVAPRVLIGFCMGLGILALIVAGGLRGFVEPVAAQHLAQRLIEGRSEAVRQGTLTAGQFLTTGTTTFYQQPRTAENDTGARTFVYLAPAPGQEQVVTAARMRLIYESGDDSGALELDGARIILFVRAEGQTRNIGAQIAVENMRLGPVPIEVPEAASFVAPTRMTTLPDLMSRWQGGDSEAGRAALERILGMALAFVAPLLAGLGLAATRGRMRLAALPAALGAVLGGGLAVPPLAGVLVGLGLAPALAAAAALPLIVALIATLIAARLLPGSVLPQRVQL
jgi:lipopolysaccharide export system permease protein